MGGNVGLRAATLDLQTRGIGNGAKRGTRELWNTGDREVVASAVAMALSEGGNRANTESGPMPGELRAVTRTRRHTSSE